MMQHSDITGKNYYDEECVFFRNCAQSARYLEWNAELLDLFTDSQHKLVFVFPRKDHDRLKNRWGTKDNNEVND